MTCDKDSWILTRLEDFLDSTDPLRYSQRNISLLLPSQFTGSI